MSSLPPVCDIIQRMDCIANNCTRQKQTDSGYCLMHYKRWKKWGSADVTHIVYDSTLSSRSRKIDKAGDCWIWTGAKTSDGYGMFRFAGVTYRTHRVAWEEANGMPVPEGMVVCHTCDTPPCVNPEHLWIGTPQENNQDKVRKGRQSTSGRPRLTYCKRGHLMDDDMVYISPDGTRSCRGCRRAREKESRK